MACRAVVFGCAALWLGTTAAGCGGNTFYAPAPSTHCTDVHFVAYDWTQPGASLNNPTPERCVAICGDSTKCLAVIRDRMPQVQCSRDCS